VATSIAAFTGASPQGPTDEPVSIASFAEYEGTFGGLAAGTTMGFAVRDFFANGGTQAYIIRATNENGAQSVKLSSRRSDYSICSVCPHSLSTAM
jgi:hypothetical protein